MPCEPAVMLDDLVLSLSDSLDRIHPCAADHQQRVAYIALRIAKAMGYGPNDRADLMYAAALHDIGLLSAEEKIQSMSMYLEDVLWHEQAGRHLLHIFPAFDRASRIVRVHHRPWSDGAPGDAADETVRMFGDMVHLADHVDRMVRRERGILGQVKAVMGEVSRLSGSEFSPEVVECFRDLAGQESFWLDIGSLRIRSLLSAMAQWPRVGLDLDALEQIAGIFNRIVDFRSRYTASHSAGVAAVAEMLARKMRFSETECRQVRIAGHLHDLGKVAIANTTLNKPEPLDPEEFDSVRSHPYYTYQILSTIEGFEEIAKWAAFHHERLDGRGYPFHLTGEEIPLCARILCVADVFTALTENRPHRERTGRKDSIPILREMAETRALDRSIVGALQKNYEELDGVRSGVQEMQSMEYVEFVGLKTRAGSSISIG
jgi:HD-GYP domain-containing protein (c-di-GMP phosphodiesterase class II)